jgi:hypothetical protein
MVIKRRYLYRDYTALGDGMVDDWKGFGRQRSWPNLGTIVAFTKDWGKPRIFFIVLLCFFTIYIVTEY